MKTVKIYTIENCSYCKLAKTLLTDRDIPFEEVLVEPSQLPELLRQSGRKTFPQVFVDESLIGGYAELEALDKNGELNRVLEEEKKTPRGHCCCG
ncbi:MAG: glutaredoxin 3 [Deltaproteobacteria bacterium]|nr:glutaredoxin 3 [Deltaproteobacteria bacterium]